MTWPTKLSFNDMVAYPRRLDELLDAGKQAGMTGIGLHIHLVEEFGLKRASELLRASGIAVTNYSAVGHWASGLDYGGHPRTLADLERNLDEALELGTDIVAVAGWPPCGGRQGPRVGPSARHRGNSRADPAREAAQPQTRDRARAPQFPQQRPDVSDLALRA